MKFKVGDKIVPINLNGLNESSICAFRGRSYVIVTWIEPSSDDDNNSLIRVKIDDSKFNFRVSASDEAYFANRFIPYVAPEKYLIIENNSVLGEFYDLENAIEFGKSLPDCDRFSIVKVEKTFQKKEIISWEEEK